MFLDRNLSVLLAHVSQDKPVVRKLYQRLLAVDWIDPWLDEEKLLPGQDLDSEIRKTVGTADVVIVCCSSNSVNKDGFLQQEIGFVLDVYDHKPDWERFIIPLRLENCDIPGRLQEWRYVDYFPVILRGWAFSRLKKSLVYRVFHPGRKPLATLKVIEGPEEMVGREIRILFESVNLGRDPNRSDILFYGLAENSSVNGLHCRLDKMASGWFITALSKTGSETFVDDRPIPFNERFPVKCGNVIRMDYPSHKPVILEIMDMSLAENQA